VIRVWIEVEHREKWTMLEQHLMIDVNTCMRWYMSIMCCFITPTGCFFRDVHEIQCIMRFNIRGIYDWYTILFYM
jgi:hypothetical protein